MNQRIKLIFAATLAASAVGSAVAQSYSDTAQVLSAQPIYERNSVPRQECFNETVTTDRVVPAQGTGYVAAGYQPNAQPAPVAERTIGAGTVIGAIIGGVVGHQFGRSSGGRDVGTGVGVVAGGLIGNQIENSPSAGQPGYAQNAAPARVNYVPETRTVQRCQTVYDSRDEVTGYTVAYRYQGRDYTTSTAFDPGATMRVQVNLSPDVSGPRR
jgi:uncharacterized protein YcfJ